MTLRNVYLRSLWGYRVAVVAWGLGLGALASLGVAFFASQTASPEARQALAGLAESFRWYAEPVAILTPGGFVTWRFGVPLAIIPAIWALLAGSRTIRGEEEAGALDVLLSAPLSRTRVAFEKAAALETAAILMGLTAGALIAVAGAASGGGFGASSALLAGLNAGLFAAAFGMLALLVSQLARESGTAAGISGTALALAFLLDSTARVVEPLGPLAWLSPMHLYTLSKPLVPGYGASLGGLLALVGLSLVSGSAGVALFRRRDIGVGGVRFPRAGRPTAGAAPRRPTPLPSGAWSLRSVFARELRAAGASTLWWAIGVGVYAGWTAALAGQLRREVARLLESVPLTTELAARLSGGDASTTAAYLSIVVFAFLPVLVAAHAITQAARWAADQGSGRLEVVLATPHPRSAILLARFASGAVATTLLALASLAGVLVGVVSSGFAVDLAKLSGAAGMLIPVALVFSGLGYLLAGWLAAAQVGGALAALALASFFLTFLGPSLGWPEAVLQFSVFQQYGTPVITGVDWGAAARLAGMAAVAVAGAVARFAGKDLCA